MPNDERSLILLRGKSNDFRAQKHNDWRSFGELDNLPFERTRIVLGIAGTLPFTWKKPYSPSFHPLKSTLLLSILIYFVVCAIIYRTNRNFVLRLGKEQTPTYVSLMFASYGLMSLFSVSSLAIVADVPAVEQVLRLWLQLNSLYREITNGSRAWNWQTAERGLLFLVLFGSPCCCMIWKTAAPDLRLDYVDLVPIMYGCTTLFSICALWIAHYSYLQSYAKDTNTAIYQNIQQGLLTSEKLQLYQDTWITIKKSSDMLSSLNAPFLSMLVSLVYLILAIYTFILFIQAGMYAAAFPVVFLGSAVVMVLYCMAKAGDLAVGQILNMFLMEKVRPITPAYCGFVRAKKALIPSLFMAVIMNVVILAQCNQPSSPYT